MARKIKTDPLDTAIEQTWYRLASGVQVDIMAIPQIFKDIRSAVDNGMDLDIAVNHAIAKYRKN